jgi:WD40 repeat protein/tetratricopeptide (TPR) repeat protein/tRNA A-37 threonylcarbamoyl transferase component Bud32
MSAPHLRKDIVPLALERQVDALCARFEADWKNAADPSRRPRIEQYLEDAPEPARAILLHELGCLEIHYRRRAGEQVSPAEYEARFPRLGLALLAAPPPTRPAAFPGAGPGLPSVIGTGHSAVAGYEILGELGRGGMGVVYKARQVGLNRVVALKMILSGVHARPQEVARFRREAEAAARLQHPNIVQIHEVGQQDGQPFLALEYVDGGSLDQQTVGQPQPPRAAAELVETLARAVHYAHQKGIAHRDLKPANVLLQRAEGSGPLRAALPKITDFGLAKQLDALESQTPSGIAVGTPNYMAPEQATGKPAEVGPACDVYALGAILYELLTGRPPFVGATALDTLEQVRSQEPVSPSRLQPKVPRDLVTICLKCLEKPAHKRYASAEALADDLRRFLEQRPILARPTGLVERAAKWARRRPAVAALLAVVVLVGALGVAGIVWQWRRAEAGRHEAEMARDEADRARRLAQDERNQAVRNLYVRLISLAQQEWLAYRPSRAEELLDECQADLRGWEWDYLKGLCQADLVTCRGHTAPVTRVAFSPDGRRLASASGTWGTAEPGEVKVWDAATGRELRTFRGHTAPVMSVAFSPDGRRLASGSASWGNTLGEVKVWDADTGDVFRTLPRSVGNVFCVAFSPEGTRLATAGADRKVRLWEVETGKEIYTLGGHDQDVFSVAFSRDGRCLASAGRDGEARVWDLSTGHELYAQLVGPADIRGVTFSPDGLQIATASWDTTVKLWDATTGQELRSCNGHSRAVLSVAFAPDSQRLASADQGGSVKVWNARNGKELLTLRGHTGPVAGVAFNHDGRRLATAASDHTVKVWDMTLGQGPRTLPHMRGLIHGLVLGPDGQPVASAGERRLPGGAMGVWIWSTASGAEPRRLPGHTGRINGMAFRPDGRRLASANDDKTVKVWDVPAARLVLTLHGHDDAVTAVAFAPDGRLASASRDRTVKVWDADDGHELFALKGHAGAVTAVAFDPQGRHLASAGADGAVKVWDTDARRELVTLGGPSDEVSALAFSPDGRLLASAGKDQRIYVWDLVTASGDGAVAPLPTLRGHTGAVRALAFSPDGQRLASGSADEAVTLWILKTGQEALTLRGHTGTVNRLAFSKDGRRLASASYEIKVWEAPELTPEARAARVREAAERTPAWHRHEAERCAADRYWFGAFFHLDRAIKLRPNEALPYVDRGSAHAELEEWDHAAADYQRAVDLGITDWTTGHPLALLRLHQKDEKGYREACSRLLQSTGPTEDAESANEVAWTCCLAPGAVPDTARVVRLAEQAVADTPGDPVCLNTLGAALYRADRFNEAVGRLEEAVRAHGQGGNPEDLLVLALAYHRLGNAEEAHRWLKKAVRWLDEKTAAQKSPDAVAPLPWDRRMELDLLRREAERALK